MLPEAIVCVKHAVAVRGSLSLTADELRECFPSDDPYDFPKYDTDRFCPIAIPFFRGEQNVGFRVVSTGGQSVNDKKEPTE